VVVALAVIAGVAAYAVTTRVRPLLGFGGCQVRAGPTAVSLDPEQAAIAATIAGVAHQRGMPARAVTVAIAAGLQESHLHNLHYGDRDSVGIFQQRPSQGWGPARKLEDPVYAASRFFAVLATVPGYRHKPVYRAAQAVQRSADGYAYISYERLAAGLSAAFTGKTAHAAWCWAGDPPGDRAELAAARRQLLKTFGPMAARLAGAPHAAPTLFVRPGPSRLGWAVAAWLVTHAASYGIHDVAYAGLRWRAATGRAGWAADQRAAGQRGAAKQAAFAGVVRAS
jgi:hypothetical protein